MILYVTNGCQITLDGLGKNKPFLGLSEKRITKSAREVLRKQFGNASVEVSCSAKASGEGWRGECKINGIPHQYRIS